MLPSAPGLELVFDWGRDRNSDRMEGTPNYAVFALPVFAAAIVADPWSPGAARQRWSPTPSTVAVARTPSQDAA